MGRRRATGAGRGNVVAFNEHDGKLNPHKKALLDSSSSSSSLATAGQESSSGYKEPPLLRDSGAIVLAVGVLVVYLRTLYPSIAGGDSGELVAESCALGVSHPPGYPLYNMLVHLTVKIFAVVPDTTPAWRANLFSAICDSACAMLMYRSSMLWMSQSHFSAHRTAALTMAAMYAFSPLTWTYAIGAEVFALNNLFAALLIYLLIKYSIGGEFSIALQGAFVCGLAMCNQHTIVLFEIPIILWVLWTRKSVLTLGEVSLFTVAFVVGLLPYAYMPLASSLNPQPGSWGDVTSWNGFWHHLRRADYGTFRLFSSNEHHESLLTRLRLYWWDVFKNQGLYLTVPLALAGSLLATRPNFLPGRFSRSLGWVVLVIYLFYLVVFHSLANLPLDQELLYGIHMRFWQQPNIIVFLFASIGLASVSDLVSYELNYLDALQQCSQMASSSHNTSGSGNGDCNGNGSDTTKFIAKEANISKLKATSSQSTTSLFSFGMQSACLNVLTFIVMQLYLWSSVCDQHNNHFIGNFGKALLDPLPKNSLLIVNYDLQWTAIRYLQQCEQFRTDVTVLNLSMMTYKWFAKKHDTYPHLKFPGTRVVPFGSQSDGFTLAQFFDANYRRFKSAQHAGMFFGGTLLYNDADLRERYTEVPFGLVDEYVPKEEPIWLTKWNKQRERNHKHVQRLLPILPPADRYDAYTWEWTIVRYFYMKKLSEATFLLEKTIEQDGSNVRLLTESIAPMEYSIKHEPKQFWSQATLKNVGLGYAQIVKSNEEIDELPPEFAVALDSASSSATSSFSSTSTAPPTLKTKDAVVKNSKSLKDFAAKRMLKVWSEWVELPEASQDPGYQAILSIVRTFGSDASKTADQPSKPNDASTSVPKKPKKRKSKKKKKRRTLSSKRDSNEENDN